MAEFLNASLSNLYELASLSELAWLIFGSCLAGLVRGFSGFGTAMVFLPFAGSVVEPVLAVTTMLVMDLVGPVFMAPRTMRQTNPGELARLTAGLILALPLGVLVLFLLPSDMFRYMVSAITLVMLVFLASGLRYSKPLTGPMVYGTGALGGFFAGCAGLPGPPVILLYLASTLPAAVIRANLFIYLIIADLAVLIAFGIRGQLYMTAILLGLTVAVPYMAMLWVGTALFNPDHERSYRIAAYAIIAASAITGLPVVSGWF